MRKLFFLWLFIAASFLANGQGNTLYTVNFVKPKAAMKSAFEAAWKSHLAKFHNTTDKRTVYEVMSGPNIGTYHIVEGPFSYADMDKEKTNAKDHGLELEKTIFNMVESSSNATYRWDDTASFNGKVEADKFLVTVTHVNFGQIGETIRESRRGALIQAKINPTSRFSANMYTQMWAGSDPVRVQIRNLKDGFKELETNYYGPSTTPANAFKDAYIKDYGQEAWDTRSKLTDNNANVASREIFLTKLRKDLSSK